VGKTLSARNYANWDKVQAYWKHQSKTKPLLKEVSKGTVVFYTSPVVTSPGRWSMTSARPAAFCIMPQSNEYGDTKMPE
jgi:hypothetical protein